MTEHTPFSPDLGPEPVNELSRAFWNSAILRAGIKLGVFSLLEQTNLSSDQVASRIGASSRFVQAFLDACVVLNLLEKSGDGYRNASLASNFLVPGNQEYVGDLVLHITNHWESWGHLDQLIQQGKTLLPFETDYVAESTYWTDYMMGQHNRAVAGQARYLVENLDLRGRRKLLDLGGGAASYSIALCKANPRLRAVVIDRQEPLAIAKRLVSEHGLQERVHLVEDDFNTANLGTDSDIVLISGVVLIKSQEECRHLFARAYDALLPGGLIIVQDFMRLDHGPHRKSLDSLMDLYVLIAFDPGAGDRPGEEIVSWLHDAGFHNTKPIPLPTHLALITAEKPSNTPSRT